MGNPNTTASKLWLLFAASTLGMLAFAGLYFFNPKASTAVQTGASTTANTVVNKLNEETKIPTDYVNALNVYKKLTNAEYAAPNQVLFNVPNVQVVISLQDAIKTVVTEDEVRAKFELVLRRNNIPIDPKSATTVQLEIDGFFNDAMPNLLCFAINTSVDEFQIVARNGEMRTAFVRVWMKGNIFGTTGKVSANEEILKEVEKRAEMFANDFLSANPKRQ